MISTRKMDVLRVLVLQERVMHYRHALYNSAARLGIRIDVACINLDGAPVYSDFGVEQLGRYRCGVMNWTKGLARLWNLYDVIVVPLDVRWIHRILCTYRNSNPAIVWWGHGFGRHQLGNWIRRKLLKQGSSLILYSDDPVNQFVDAGVPRGSIFVAHNTVHVANAYLDEAVVRDQFLYVGRLQVRKRLDEAIRAFAQANLGDHIRLTILGDGDIRKELQAVAEHQNVAKRVRFLPGTTDAEDLKLEFSRSFAYVSPGHVGLGVLHSFAYGVPVITRSEARHAPEFSNLRNGTNSILYDGSISALSKSMELMTQQGQALILGRAAFKHYSRNRTIDGMARTFTEAIRFAHSVKHSK